MKNQSLIPKITVITCTFNSQKHIADCIQSIQKQSFQEYEHIFIDGNSTDDTINIIKQFYKNPVIFAGKDNGVYGAFNRAMNHVSGEIFGFLHSDDCYYDSDCLMRVYNAFKKNPDIDYYSSRMVQYNETMDTVITVMGDKPHKPSLKEHLWRSNYYAHPTYYYKTAKAKEIGLYDDSLKIAADIDWLMRLERQTDKFYFDPAPLIKFRIGGTSAQKKYKTLNEEFLVRRKNEGLTLSLIIIYGFHTVKLIIRSIIISAHLDVLLKIFRKLRKRINGF